MIFKKRVTKIPKKKARKHSRERKDKMKSEIVKNRKRKIQ